MESVGLQKLPFELGIGGLIGRYLDTRDYLTLREVCKSFKHSVDEKKYLEMTHRVMSKMKRSQKKAYLCLISYRYEDIPDSFNINEGKSIVKPVGSKFIDVEFPIPEGIFKKVHETLSVLSLKKEKFSSKELAILSCKMEMRPQIVEDLYNQVKIIEDEVRASCEDPQTSTISPVNYAWVCSIGDT